MLNKSRDFRDLEDIVIRVKVMAAIAHDHLSHMPRNADGLSYEKLCHLVRATSELAEQLHDGFHAAHEASGAAA